MESTSGALARFNARIHQHNNAKAGWVDTHRAQRLQLLRQRRDGGPLVGMRPLRLGALALQLSELLLQPGQLRAVAVARLYPNHTARQAAWFEGERSSILCCVIFHMFIIASVFMKHGTSACKKRAST